MTTDLLYTPFKFLGMWIYLTRCIRKLNVASHHRCLRAILRISNAKQMHITDHRIPKQIYFRWFNSSIVGTKEKMDLLIEYLMVWLCILWQWMIHIAGEGAKIFFVHFWIKVWNLVCIICFHHEAIFSRKPPQIRPIKHPKMYYLTVTVVFHNKHIKLGIKWKLTLWWDQHYTFNA